jgi:general secretion pathway protein D
VLALRRSLALVLPLVVLVLWTPAAPGQEADADQARSMLEKGIAQHDALRFSEARDTLMEVDAAALSDEQQDLLDEYLRKCNTGIRKQGAAMQAFEAAEKALQRGDLSAAEAGYATAAGSEYLPPEMRAWAGKQLAQVQQRRSQQQDADADEPAELNEIAEAAPEMEMQPLAASSTTQPAEPTEETARPLEMQPAAETDEPMDRPAEAARPLVDLPSDQPRAREVESVRVVNRLRQKRALAKQQADLEFERAMRRSREADAGADSASEFDSAEEYARVARNTIESNKSLFTAEEYEQRIAEADQQLEYIARKREKWSRQKAQEELDELNRLQRQREMREAEQRQRKVETLKQRVRSLEKKQQYETALATVDQILQLDPESKWAVWRKDWLQTLTVVEDQDAIGHQAARQEQKVILDVLRSNIPWHQLLRFPRDWAELTARRMGAQAAAGGESERDRAVRRQMQETVLQKVDFDGIAFSDVVDFLREVSGLNIYVNWNSLQTVGIDQSVPVNVNLTNVSFEKVLTTVLDDVGGVAAQLGYVIDEGVITVSTQEDLSRKTVTRVYDILDLIHPVPDFSAPDLELGEQEEGGGFGDGGDGGGGGLFGDDGDGDGGEAVSVSRSGMVESIVMLIQETIDPNSWRPTGDIGSVRELGGQLVITQTAQNHQSIVNLLNQLREATQLQIAIEARFLDVSTSFLESIGVNLDFYFNIGSRLGSSIAIDPWTGAIVPTDGTILGPTASAWGAGKPGSPDFTPISALNAAVSSWTSGVSTGVPNSVGGAATPFSLSGVFLDDIQVDFLLEAVQAHEGSRTLNAPRLTLLNGQRSNVVLTQSITYVSDVDVEREDDTADVADDFQTITFEYEFTTLEYGTVLDVRGTVSGDRRYVTLNLYPRVTDVTGFNSFVIEFSPVTGEPITIQQPQIATQRVSTTVTVPDGGTLLIGGQKLAGEMRREQGVPLLNKIPVINRAFTNRAEIRDEYSLLILVKPKILIRSEAEQREELYQEEPMLP